MMTLKSEPPKINAGHNPMVFVVDSDNKTETNYKYICDVYVSSVRIARLKNNPNPNFGSYGIFDVSKILQSYLNSDYFTAPAILAYISPKLAYTVKFSERYESGGGEIINDDVVVADEKYAFNTSYNYLQSSFFIDDSTPTNNLIDRQFITDRPGTISVTEGTDFFMSGFTTTPDVSVITFALKVTTYTGLNQTGAASTTTWPASIDKNNDFIANFGTNGLTNAGISLTGIQSYKIDLYIDGVVLQDTLLFNIDLCEPKYDLSHFVFLNKLGGFESVYFTKASRKTIELDRKVMQSQGTVFNTTNFTVDTKDSNNVFYEQRKVFGVRHTTKLKVNSDWLTDDEYVWLTDLVTSNAIYYQHTIPASLGITSRTVYVPVSLTNKDYEVKKRINEKLTQIELEFDFGFNNYSQLR